MVARFRAMLAAAEHERREAMRGDVRPSVAGSRSWLHRMKARALCWIAEAIAQQRLLWALRGEAEAVLAYPSDIPDTTAEAVMRARLRHDFGRHRFWLTIDMFGLVGSVLLVPIPGPNFVWYYFAFRVVGHFLSLRGARQGLEVVEWKRSPSDQLTDLRAAIHLDPPQRERRVHEVATRLHLEHLPAFFNRTALPDA